MRILAAINRDVNTSACQTSRAHDRKKVDLSKTLAPNGPHGIPFEKMAADFHVSFIISVDQTRFQKGERIREASLSCGYRFQVDR